MAYIKLYGKIHNQDGNLLVSPLEVAGVNSDGSIPEGAATSENNIVSYINEKIKGVNTNVGNIKTGIKSVEFSNVTLLPGTHETTLTVTGNDDTSQAATLNIDGSSIVKDVIVNNTSVIPAFGATSTLATLRGQTWDDEYFTQNIYITLPDNNAVGEAWGKSTTATNYKQSVTNAIGTAKTEAIDAAATDATSKSNKALTDAKKYADDQIGMKLGKVYKPQGNANLTTIVTINPKNNIGNVWNMTEKFMIDGVIYPKYTNVVIVDSESLPTTLEYNTKTGFSGEVVDALGGMFDQTAIQNDINNKFNKSIVKINSSENYITFDPVSSNTIIRPKVTYVLGDNSTGEFDLKLHCLGVPTASKKQRGLVKIGSNIEIDGEGCINILTADSAGTLGLVKSNSSSSVSISRNGELDVKLANDSGIKKSANGELSITKNTFNAAIGIDIQKTGDAFSIGFSTTYIGTSGNPEGQPLYYNIIKNGFYVNTDSNLSVTTNTDKSTKISINTATLKSTLNLNSKADVSTVTALEKRVEALESLLSLG